MQPHSAQATIAASRHEPDGYSIFVDGEIYTDVRE